MRAHPRRCTRASSERTAALAGPPRGVLWAISIAVPITTFAWLVSFHNTYVEPFQRIGYRCLALSLMTGGIVLAATLVLRKRTQPTNPGAMGAAIMNSTRLQIAHLMWNKYKTEYDAIFPVRLDPALADVINFYSYGGGDVGDSGITKEISPITFTSAESTGLVDLMKTLDGEAVPTALLQNTSK